MELPAAPLSQLVVGMLTGSQQPELLIATAGAGVLAFDGHVFRQILANQDEARNVTALLPLASGRLLIGTAKLGLLIFDGAVLKRFHSTTDNVYVTALAGTDAELWVGTLDNGLLYWHGGETERIGEEQGMPDRRVEQIALGKGTSLCRHSRWCCRSARRQNHARACEGQVRPCLASRRGLALGRPVGGRGFARPTGRA
jgi:hypothetical protein